MGTRGTRALGVAALALGLGACGSAEGTATEPYEGQDADLDVTDLGADADKEDSAVGFKPGLILTDDEFTDVDAMSEADVKLFLEAPPYGWPSGLTTQKFSEPVERMIVAAARKYTINPLIILTKLQVEQGLISIKTPTKRRLLAAMGCGCPDGADCSTADSGFHLQLDCGAETLRKAYDEAAILGETLGGIRKGVSFNPYDPDVASVIPQNYATVSLYNYTPWVLKNTGGNWLMWNVYRQYKKHLGYEPKRAMNGAPRRPVRISPEPGMTDRETPIVVSITPDEEGTPLRVHAIFFKDTTATVNARKVIRQEVAWMTTVAETWETEIPFDLSRQRLLTGTLRARFIVDDTMRFSEPTAVEEFVFPR